MGGLGRPVGEERESDRNDFQGEVRAGEGYDGDLRSQKFGVVRGQKDKMSCRQYGLLTLEYALSSPIL